MATRLMLTEACVIDWAIYKSMTKIIIVTLIVLNILTLISCINGVAEKKVIPNTDNEITKNLKSDLDNENCGGLVGVWLDSHSSKNYKLRIGQKVILKDNKLYFGPCDIDKESLELNSESIVPYTEIAYNGDAYIDINIPDQKLLITKTGDLKIYDQLGLVATYPCIFIDHSILKY